MSRYIDETFAQAFATDWIEAWNSADLERILSHYTEDFEMSSPLIASRGFAASGRLKGKAAIRPYWGMGLEQAQPPLKFELICVYTGINTACIHYLSVGRRYVIEVIEFNEHRQAIRGHASYGAPSPHDAD